MRRNGPTKTSELLHEREAPLATPTDLTRSATKDIAGAMNAILAMTDPIAERIRKIGGLTLRSIGHISRTQRVLDNDADYVDPPDMIAELADDNKTLAARLRETHNVCDEHRDVATASLIEVWIDETERRTWFLSEIKRGKQ